MKKVAIYARVSTDKQSTENQIIALKEIAERLATELKQENIKPDPETEIIALIAYLQRMGTDIKKAEKVPVK